MDTPSSDKVEKYRIVNYENVIIEKYNYEKKKRKIEMKIKNGEIDRNC